MQMTITEALGLNPDQAEQCFAALEAITGRLSEVLPPDPRMIVVVTWSMHMAAMRLVNETSPSVASALHDAFADGWKSMSVEAE